MDKFDEEVQKYKEMCNIASRLIDISMCNGTLNSDDSELIEFLNNEEKVKILSERLKNSFRAEKCMEYFDSADSKLDTQLLVDKLNKIRKNNKSILYRKISTVAAVLIASFALLYYTTDKPDSEILSYNTPYESNVPVILFDNGEHIDLSDTTDEKLIQRQNISITGASKIKYDNTEVVNENSVRYNTAIVPAKHTLDIELADGTKVKLNANSTLRFPLNFSNNDRTVEMTGEGYFVVAKSSKPFVVKVGNCAVQVYGTEFNVNMNKRDVIETTLIEGSISFKTRNNEEVMLHPNQCVRLNKETNAIGVSTINVENILGWKNGYFLYEQEKLIVLLNEISNWYGVNIIIENKLVLNNEVSLNVDRSILLPDLLKLLEQMLDIKFVNEGNGKYLLI